MDLLSYFDAYATRYQLYKGGRWCYEDGLLYIALTRLHLHTGEDRWLNHLTRLANAQIAPDGSLRDYEIAEYNIDNILAGRCLFHLSKVTGDTRYMAAADLLAKQLETHPRIPAGNYWHKNVYPHQVWLDGLYMALPFQIEYGLTRGNEALVADALAQLRSALVLTKGPKGLFMHGYDDARAQKWADPVTGLSPALWGRSVGWLAMAMVDICDLLQGRDDAPGAETTALLNAMHAMQQPSGLWQQVLDMPDLAGNYDESSASAMMAYALVKGHRLGLVDDAAGKSGVRAHRALCETRLVTIDGMTQLDRICCVAGLGGFSGVYRDGTPEYYVGETVVADDIKGVSPFMTASVELL